VSAPSAKRVKLDPDAATSPTESALSISLEDAVFWGPKAQQSEHARTSLLTTHDGSPDDGDHASPLLDAIDSVMTRRIPVAEGGMSHATDSPNARLSVFSDSGECVNSRLYSVTPPPPSGVPAVPSLSSPLEIISVRSNSVESSDSDFLFLGVDGVPDTPKSHSPCARSVFSVGLENTPLKNRGQRLTPVAFGMHGAPNPLLQYGGAMYGENAPISKSLGKRPQRDFDSSL
jgi:hypothetical protein